MVGADDIDNVDIFARANAFGLASGAKKTVGGTLALGIGAAGRAHDGGAVLLEASARDRVSTQWMQTHKDDSGRDRECVHDNVLSNVDGKLADTGAAKLLHDPVAAAGQVLFLLVRY